MKIIKRNGAEVAFDIDKIRIAITKANEAADEKVRMTPTQIDRIARQVEISCEDPGPGGKGHHGPRRIRSGQGLHHLPLYPQSYAPGQHHGRPDSDSH